MGEQGFVKETMDMLEERSGRRQIGKGWGSEVGVCMENRSLKT